MGVPDNGGTDPHPATGVAHGSFGKAGGNAKFGQVHPERESSGNGISNLPARIRFADDELLHNRGRQKLVALRTMK